jgi:hypothetical protein
MSEPTSPRGRLLARYLKAVAIARGNSDGAAAYVASQRWAEAGQIERILKAGVSAMGTDQATAQHAVTQDLASLVAPLSIIGRLQASARPERRQITRPRGGRVLGQPRCADPAGQPLFSDVMLREIAARG